MQGVILAAGKGSRLNPITINRSKAMLPILGKPIVARVFENIFNHGISDFVLVVSNKDSEIVEYFEKNKPPGVKIKYALQKKRLGMAHALKVASRYIKEDFVLSACDNLVNPDLLGKLISKYQRKKAKAAISLLQVAESLIPKTGIVELDGTYVKRIVEKPSLEAAPSNIASIPLYVLSQKILEFLPEVKLSPRGEYEFQDALQMLIDRYGEVWGVFTDYRLTLTSPKDLLEINLHFLRNSDEAGKSNFYIIGRGTKLIKPLRIESGTKIGKRCRIGPNVYIEENCLIEDEVLIKDAVVLRRSRLKSGLKVCSGLIS